MWKGSKIRRRVQPLGGWIQEGDTVILDSPHKIPSFTKLTGGPTDHRLQVGADMAQWLADHKVQCVGFCCRPTGLLP